MSSRDWYVFFPRLDPDTHIPLTNSQVLNEILTDINVKNYKVEPSSNTPFYGSILSLKVVLPAGLQGDADVITEALGNIRQYQVHGEVMPFIRPCLQLR